MGPGEVAVVLGALGIFTVKLVEFIRKAFPVITGMWINLAAIVVGIVLAYAFDLRVGAAISELVGAQIRDFPAFVDYVIAGVWSASAAGYLADNIGLSNPTNRFQ